MDYKQTALTDLLKILEDRGIFTSEQTQTIRIRQGVIRALIKKEKMHGSLNQRYEPNPVEIVLASGTIPANGVVLEEEMLVELWANAKDVPYLRIDPLRLDAKLITESFSQNFARLNVVLPISLKDNVLTVATDYPQNDELVRMLKSTQRYDIATVLASRTSILRSISETYGFRTSVNAAATEQTQSANLAAMAIGNLEQFMKIRQLEEIDSSDSHIVNAVDYLLNYAFAQRATDIHIEPHRDNCVVRLRIDGVLHVIHTLPIIVHSPIVARLKTLSRMDIAEKRRPQDGRIKTEYESNEVELRVSTMPVAFGEKMVIRILNTGKLFHGIDQLGMVEEELARFKRMLASRTGLILVTGPTGSGKTTTLYSALQVLSSPEVNITTVEDPVEMVCEAFNQVQVQPKIGLDFAHALRTVLRQDPDIIMVGEIRDEETAHMAVQAALTGHLVLSTLHTNDAPSAITRLLDLNVPPFLLSSCLVGCIAQRLVRKICPHCRTERELTEDEIHILGLRQSSSQRTALHVAEGTGCVDCRKTGMYGQIGVFEVLEVNQTMRHLIHDAADAERLKRTARSDGMNTLLESALKKLGNREIPYGEVVRVLGLGEK
ncbi:MAG: type II/IV secretion system protein [Proteobacteria bacterium]|nr:type II/IV secretion system protein [Pseudomonadota bacterium]